MSGSRSRVLLAAALLASGCVTTAEQGRRMQSDIDRLEARIEQTREALDEQNQVLDAGIGRIDAKIAEVTKTMEALGLAARKNDANFGVTIDGLIRDLQVVRGELEELRFKMGQVESQVSNTREETDRRLEALKGDEAVAAYQLRQKAKKLADEGQKKELLDLATAQLRAGENLLAREMLKTWLGKWPTDPLAAGAQALVAESYFQEKDWRPAILEYNKFREKHPDHPLVPGAILNIGESFAALGLKPEAGKFYDALMARFPDSEAAGKAARRKKELGLD